MKTDEWYTDAQTARKCYELLNPEPNSVILCPFDSEQSEFVKIGQELGHVIIFGIRDFLDGGEYECDYICTNPPFSIKDAVIEKCFESAKRTVLVMPLDVIGGLSRRKIYQRYELPKVWLPARRIGYFDENWIKRPSSNFHSVILTLNHGETSTLDWEII